MARVSAYGTLDQHSVLFHAEAFRTFKGSVALLTTYLTILVFFERTIQKCQFAKLLLLVHILFVINHHQHLFYHIRCCVDRSLVITGNDHVKGFVVALHNLAIPSSPCSFLNRSAPADGDLASRLGLQLFLCLTTWSDDQSNKIVLRVLFDWNSNFLGSFAFEQSGLTGGWIHVHQFFKYVVALGSASLSPTNGPCIFAFAIGTVN